MEAYHIEQQVPNGCKSRGYDFKDADEAHEVFELLTRQLEFFGDPIDLVMFKDGVEVARAHVNS